MQIVVSDFCMTVLIGLNKISVDGFDFIVFRHELK